MDFLETVKQRIPEPRTTETTGRPRSQKKGRAVTSIYAGILAV
jgi:hypothetical protein